MGLEVREVGPIETPRHEDTVYLPATTVPPTVVALRPKRAETVSQAQFPQMGIDPGRHQSMKIIPSMHVKSPEAIIARRGGVTVPRATRCTRRVAPGQTSPAAPSRARQPGPPWGPRGAPRRVRYAPPTSRVGQRGRPRRPSPRIAVPPVPTAAGIATARRLPRPPAPLSPPRWPPAHRGPRSTTSSPGSLPSCAALPAALPRPPSSRHSRPVHSSQLCPVFCGAGGAGGRAVNIVGGGLQAGATGQWRGARGAVIRRHTRGS